MLAMILAVLVTCCTKLMEIRNITLSLLTFSLNCFFLFEVNGILLGNGNQKLNETKLIRDLVQQKLGKVKLLIICKELSLILFATAVSITRMYFSSTRHGPAQYSARISAI